MLAASASILSARQAEIAELVVSGKSSREIAGVLSLSPRTVETHIGAIFNKLGVSTRAELILKVLGAGGRERPTPAPAIAARTNLPSELSELVGRENEIAELADSVRGRRLVTITGAGGVGKTRVAVAVGRALLVTTTARVVFVELAATKPGSVAESLARTLEIGSTQQGDAVDALITCLEPQRIVLILDNCEHVVAEAAIVAQRLLYACPNLTILATSREPLRVAPEHVHRLPSLSIPTLGEALNLRAATGPAYASIVLFSERARAANHRFRLTDGNVALVADICRRLDGIPLALELAASRTTMLSIEALASRLDVELRILARSGSGALPRHQTMRAVIDWSYDLLSAAEQHLFDRLSIFSEGCTLAEAAAMCGNMATDELAALDLLTSLVDKSLVVADLSHREPRYTLLTSFAQYGWERLRARGETEFVARLHARIYTALAERLYAAFDVEPNRAWDERTRCELGNWRSALRFTLEERGDVELGQRLAVATRPMWFATSEVRWVQLACDLIDERTPAKVIADLQFALADTAAWNSTLEVSLAACERAIAAYRALGDDAQLGRSQGFMAQILVFLDRIDEAEPFLQAAVACAQAQEHAPWWAWTVPLQTSAAICRQRGEATQMYANLESVLSIFERLGADRYAANVRMNLAHLEFASGNVDRAFERTGAGLQAIRELGYSRSLALYLNNTALYCIALQRWNEARSYAREALEISKAGHYAAQIGWALQRIAVIAAFSATPAQRPVPGLGAAAQLIGYVDALLRQMGAKRQSDEHNEYERLSAVLRSSLGADEFAALVASGATMTQDQAIASALALCAMHEPHDSSAIA